LGCDVAMLIPASRTEDTHGIDKKRRVVGTILVAGVARPKRYDFPLVREV
jgi:hypothetical protein